MGETKCKHCGARIIEYRGSWFGPGDDVICDMNGQATRFERRHEPVEPSWMAQARAAGWTPPPRDRA